VTYQNAKHDSIGSEERSLEANHLYLPYVCIPNALTPHECEVVRQLDIGRAEGTLGSAGEIDRVVRRSTLRWISRNATTEWLYQRIERIASDVNAAYYGFDLVGFHDSLQLADYGVEDHYRWHQDSGAGSLSRRKLSVSVLLSDVTEYEGGLLEFWSDTYKQEIDNVRFPQGMLIAFPGYQVHRVTAVLRGHRLSLVAWFDGPPFR
jgi:PKHD-type hydroxylase